MTEWRTSAACYGTFNPDFFAPKGGNWASRRAKAICWNRCPVRVECLDYAIQTRAYYGIFGGMTERERRVYKREAA